MDFTIRPLNSKDVEEYLALTKYIDAETDFLGSSPNDKRPTTVQMITSISSNRQIYFVAANEFGLIGHIGAFWRRGKGERVKHTMVVGLGVAKDFWGKGIGNALFEATEQKAKEIGITRLELEVMTHNKGAIALYKKRGFEIEGTKRNSIKIGDQYIDEYIMAKLL
ncbi:MAG: GNAT family N-acetyltransferase [Saprospiraceae bacterium]|nr:GNAT family N-acetyltransferase [Saprospiraceae bacterium]